MTLLDSFDREEISRGDKELPLLTQAAAPESIVDRAEFSVGVDFTDPVIQHLASKSS